MFFSVNICRRGNIREYQWGTCFSLRNAVSLYVDFQFSSENRLLTAR
jgi:hypothetical protein